MKTQTKVTLKDTRFSKKAPGTHHITGVLVNVTQDIAEVEFWNFDSTGIVSEFYDTDELREATWRERLDSSRDNVREMFANLETALNDALAVPNSMLPAELHDNSSKDGQSFTKLTAKMAGGKAKVAKLSEKEDRAERVELYTAQVEAGRVEAGEGLAYRPFVHNRTDDLNPELAHLFGVDETEESDELAYAETCEA